MYSAYALRYHRESCLWTSHFSYLWTGLFTIFIIFPLPTNPSYIASLYPIGDVGDRKMSEQSREFEVLKRMWYWKHYKSPDWLSFLFLATLLLLSRAILFSHFSDKALVASVQCLPINKTEGQKLHSGGNTFTLAFCSQQNNWRSVHTLFSPLWEHCVVCGTY